MPDGFKVTAWPLNRRRYDYRLQHYWKFLFWRLKYQSAEWNSTLFPKSKKNLISAIKSQVSDNLCLQSIRNYYDRANSLGE